MQPGPPYPQGPQYPTQGYPQQGYPQPGYPQPGYPPPKKSNTGLIVGLIIGVVVVLGGGGVGAFFLLSGNGSSSSAAPSSSKPSGPPDKYTTMPDCKKIEQGVQNMPPLESPKGQERASTSGTDIELYSSSCNWYKYQEWSASVTMYLSKSTQPGSGAGERYAKAGYENAADDGGEEIPNMEKAAKAAYININSEGQCSIKFYQGNIDTQIIVSGPDPMKKVDQKFCKENALKVAKAASHAIG